MWRKLNLAVMALLLAAIPLAADDATKLPATLGDLTLINGKAFKGVVVISQSSTAINVRHAGGLTKIEKSLLPPEVLARFPVDEALAGQEQQARQAEAQRRDEANRVAQQRKAERDRKVAEARAQEAASQAANQTATPGQPASIATDPRTSSPHGLYIGGWYTSGSSVEVTLSNPTDTSQRFDPRQLRGLIQGTETTLQPGDLQFRADQKIDDRLNPGEQKSFRFTFSGSPQISALAWDDGKEWRVKSGAAYATKADANAATSQALAEQKASSRRASASSAAASTQREAEKNLITK